MDLISILSIFVMACFVGYYVVWSVTPAHHASLMMVAMDGNVVNERVLG